MINLPSIKINQNEGQTKGIFHSINIKVDHMNFKYSHIVGKKLEKVVNFVRQVFQKNAQKK